MKTFEHGIEIDAPVATAWALTIDVERWPSLFPTVTTVERLDTGPMQLGSRARIKQPGQPNRVWTVTEFSPNRRFVWTTSAWGFAMRAEHVLTPTSAGGTSNLLRIVLDGPLAGVVAALGGRQIRKTLATENEGFRVAATAAAGARAGGRA